ncbi:uncharacterized protein EI90DRAFT_2539113 [Cantharellus anzutake]|uniref:uncharacterized protein n=1 Tax=Cantharellus anzutake TaxID=1750568 RepID=UPI0019079AA6|nr:uncharacterized protein EI90DRAFT_2539113 [Cantharellus anzutake]KAF8338085.1 hypothetical protein EI90DRAFT_2539113 [Cantharellus anzutake]
MALSCIYLARRGDGRMVERHFYPQHILSSNYQLCASNDPSEQTNQRHPPQFGCPKIPVRVSMGGLTISQFGEPNCTSITTFSERNILEMAPGRTMRGIVLQPDFLRIILISGSAINRLIILPFIYSISDCHCIELQVNAHDLLYNHFLVPHCSFYMF